MKPIIKDQLGDVCRDLYVERDSLYALCELLENEFSECHSSHPDAYIISGRHTKQNSQQAPFILNGGKGGLSLS